MAREPMLMAVCGRKGVGKSFTTMEKLREYVRGNPELGVPGRRVLIFDVNNEYSDKAKFPDIRAIAMKDIQRYSQRPVAEIRRIAPFFDDGRPMTLDDMGAVLQWLVTNFKNGLLLIEDINKYVSDSMPGDLIGAICTNRHTGVDIILHYQSIGRLSPKVWQNINVIRMHKNTDTVERHARQKFPDKLQLMTIAEKIIDHQFYNLNDERFYLYVSFDRDKVYADVPEEVIKDAIADYISENYNSLIVPMLNKRGRQGEKIYEPETVVVAKEQQLYKQYFEAS